LQNQRTGAKEVELLMSCLKPICILTILPLVTANAMAETVTFDSDPIDRPPAGWACGTTGKGTPRWTVEAEGSAPSQPHVLKQFGKAAFPWCVKENIELTNGTLEVKFKAISGKEDQAGGLVWRWKDGNNYYVARANALENNVSLYYTINGKRNTIKYVDAPVALNKWHTLRVDFQGAMIRVSLNDKTYISVEDSHLSGAGKAGVWTKADSVTLFDDFRYAARSTN
jgi:hypothetical protein